MKGTELSVKAKDEETLKRVFILIQELVSIADGGHYIKLSDVRYGVKMLKELNRMQSSIQTTVRGKPIRPRTEGQREYVRCIQENDIVFAIGPAGTGKTYIAVAMAVRALKKKQISRIILVRPAVEAGEKLGFLPGDLQEKVAPYLRPLYDALYDMLEIELFQKYLERGTIEVAPLAYMRGRTLNDSFIILDEAQNTTPEQMKMFLTRLGFGSKMVITGDITQIDLPQGKGSGLVLIQNILKGIDGIAFVYLTDRDVVRHDLVQKIIKAYEKYENQSE